MRTLVLLSFVALLTACASTKGPSSTASSPTSPSAPAQPSVAGPLQQEQRWLNEWFSGTPVVIAAADDGALRVEVPLKHSFDAGQAKIKAPLGAVLDKVATSLRRQGAVRLQIAAPLDNGQAGAVAQERGTSVRDYLVSKGVQPRRITQLPARAAAVELRLVAMQAIDRLEDPPSAGRAAPTTR